MSINAIPSTNNSYVNYVNYTRTPVAFRANNSAPQNKSMSTETKLFIGGGVVAGAAALVIGAKKGLFGTNIKNKINELFKKIGGDAKAKAEQEAKLKAEQEAKAKAEKEAQERARNISSQSKKTSNNTGSATTSSSSSSSGSSNSDSSSSTRHSSGRRNSGGHFGSSRSTNNSTGSSSNVNSTNTAAKPNGSGQTSTAQPKPQNNAAKPNTNPQPIVPPKAQGTVQPKPHSAPNTNAQPTKPKTPTAQTKPEPAAQPKPKVTQPPKEILDKINELNAAYADALKDQPISFIKTFENGEVVTTASVKTEQPIETMLSEVPANVPEALKQELKAAFEQELEKLKLVRTGKVDDEKMLEEFSSKVSDFFENIDNNPALSSIKNKIEQWGNQVQQDTNRILQNIERDAVEAKEAQRKIDIAQAVHTAQGGFRLSGKSAEESAEVFSEAMRKENRNARRMMQNAYDEAAAGRLDYIDSKEQATKYLMQKIEQYVQKCGTFKKVNKNVEINGERVNIIYEGIDVDITSEGKLLKKVFVSKPQKAPEMQYENLTKRLADQIEADAEYASRQAQRQRQRQRQAQQQRRMLNA